MYLSRAVTRLAPLNHTGSGTHMLRILAMFAILPILSAGLAARAGETPHAHGSKYTGQETRSVKSLSPEDIAELERGGGWGLAKPAELNGVPGPAHLLELKDAIPLTAAQTEALTGLYVRMKARAVVQGKRLIALESRLDSLFRTRTITDAALRAALDAIADTRKDLRYIHLSTHLETPRILSEGQIEKYNLLRGYTNEPRG